jgi:hypothetical protein
MTYPVGGMQSDSMAANPAPSNTISSLGAPPPVQQPNPSANKAQELINNFGNIFQQLNTLAGSYPGAGAEFNLVVESLKNWLAKASDSIASEGGMNSPTY